MENEVGNKNSKYGILGVFGSWFLAKTGLYGDENAFWTLKNRRIWAFLGCFSRAFWLVLVDFSSLFVRFG